MLFLPHFAASFYIYLLILTDGQFMYVINAFMQVKEVAAKLWYPFIPPAASSDSEEEDSFAQVTDIYLTCDEKPLNIICVCVSTHQ